MAEFSIVSDFTTEVEHLALSSVHTVTPVVVFLVALQAAIVFDTSGALRIASGCNTIASAVDIICLKDNHRACLFSTYRQGKLFYLGMKNGKLLSVPGSGPSSVASDILMYNHLDTEILFTLNAIADCGETGTVIRGPSSRPCTVSLQATASKSHVNIVSRTHRWKLRSSQFRARSSVAHKQYGKLKKTCKRRIGPYTAVPPTDGDVMSIALVRPDTNEMKAFLDGSCPPHHAFTADTCKPFGKRGRLQEVYPIY